MQRQLYVEIHLEGHRGWLFPHHQLVHMQQLQGKLTLKFLRPLFTGMTNYISWSISIAGRLGEASKVDVTLLIRKKERVKLLHIP